MPDNQAQQIMKSDAYRPQGYGGEWLGTQLEYITNDGKTADEERQAKMTALSYALLAAIVGVVLIALGVLARVTR